MQSVSADQSYDSLNPGDHLCCIFESSEEFDYLLACHTASAFKNSESVLIVTASRTEEEIIRILKSAEIELPDESEKRLSVRKADGLLVVDGEFNPEEILGAIELEIEQAIQSGHRALRLICEVPLIDGLEESSAGLVEFEAKLDRLLTFSKCIAVCLYDRREFNSEILLNVLHAHPVVVFGNKSHENLCYIPSADLLGNEVPDVMLHNILKNLSALVQKEEELEDYRERLRAMHSATFEGIVLHDHGTILAVNDTLTSMFGYQLSEFIGASILKFIVPEDRDLMRDHIAADYEFQYDIRGIRKDGSVIPIEVRGKALTFGGRRFRIAAVRDVSEHKKALDALQRSELKFRELADFLPETIFEMDLTAQLTFANQAGTDLFGYTMDDMQNRLGPLDLIAPEDKERAAKELSRVLGGQYLGGHEYIAIKKNGERVPILIHCAPIMDGTICRGARGVIVDMTEQKRAEQALRESEEKYRSIFENIHDVYYETSLDGRILEVSPSIKRTSSYTREDLIGKLITEIYADPDRRADFLENMEKHGRVDDYEITFRDADGKSILCSVSSCFIFDESGKPKKIIGTIRNISERKQVEDEIRRKNAELRHALSVKAEFLSMVSHELRTPLVPIMGYSELLLGDSMGVLKGEQREVVEVIYKRAETLRTLIEDLLLLSRMEREVLKVYPEPVKLHEYVPDLIESYRDISQPKNVSIEWDGVECEVLADPARLRQVLLNLIGNAVKYSKETVEIRICSKLHTDYCEISIEDNGLGIEREYIPYVFDRFYQVESVDTRFHDGTGLGLAVSKELVELMGGYIFAESRYGEGSTFTIGLPRPDRTGNIIDKATTIKEITEGSVDAPPETEDHGTDRMVVLIIDDDPFTQQLLDRMLSGKYVILRAMTGDEGMAIITGSRVDIILLDWMMPGTDGLSLLIKLKSDDATKDIPVVFISGKAEQESVDRALGEGACDFVTKPFRRNDLISRIEKAKTGDWEIKCKSRS